LDDDIFNFTGSSHGGHTVTHKRMLTAGQDDESRSYNEALDGHDLSLLHTNYVSNSASWALRFSEEQELHQQTLRLCITAHLNQKEPESNGLSRESDKRKAGGKLKVVR
jgi:hypothetical protein